MRADDSGHTLLMRDLDRRFDAMLHQARQQDPSIDPKAGAVILRACLDELAADPHASAAELARRCVARYRAADASWVAHLARAAVTTRAAERTSQVGPRARARPSPPMR